MSWVGHKRFAGFALKNQHFLSMKKLLFSIFLSITLSGSSQSLTNGVSTNVVAYQMAVWQDVTNLINYALSGGNFNTNTWPLVLSNPIANTNLNTAQLGIINGLLSIISGAGLTNTSLNVPVFYNLDGDVNPIKIHDTVASFYYTGNFTASNNVPNIIYTNIAPANLPYVPIYRADGFIVGTNATSGTALMTVQFTDENGTNSLAVMPTCNFASLLQTNGSCTFHAISNTTISVTLTTTGTTKGIAGIAISKLTK